MEGIRHKFNDMTINDTTEYVVNCDFDKIESELFNEDQLKLINRTIRFDQSEIPMPSHRLFVPAEKHFVTRKDFMLICDSILNRVRSECAGCQDNKTDEPWEHWGISGCKCIFDYHADVYLDMVLSDLNLKYESRNQCKIDICNYYHYQYKREKEEKSYTGPRDEMEDEMVLELDLKATHSIPLARPSSWYVQNH